MMDRPEWIAVHPASGDVYCALTNNTRRGASPPSVNAADGTTPAGAARPPADAANPRADNVFGHILRWHEADGDAGSTTFHWDIFLQCGDPAHADPGKRGNIRGDGFGSPDGLYIDADGRLWIHTDVSPGALNQGNYANLGNNQLLCANTVTGEVRRFLTGPVGCEVTGATQTPDGTTMFVNIQHPGETPGERSDPGNTTAFSSWPLGGRPRSATLAIRRRDGGKIGS
jgi:secreted PhoX family phosphatase